MAFGRAQRAAVANTVGAYRRMLREAAGIPPADLTRHGAAIAARLGREEPELLAEIAGLADGAGQQVEELVAINARTELLGGVGAAECSVVARIDAAGVRLTQTWDWHPALAGSRVIWTVEEPDGHWFTTVTEAGILAKLGLNGSGLACGLNFLRSTGDGGAGGTPIHLLLRLVLQRSRRIADATALLLAARVSASSCITLASREQSAPALVAVELSPAGAYVVRPDGDGTLLHTNHFLAPAGAAHDAQHALGPGSVQRYERLSEAMRRGEDPTSALAAHLPEGEPLCRHRDRTLPWADQRATLLALDIDPGVPSLAVAAGPPCATPFERVELPAGERRAA